MKKLIIGISLFIVIILLTTMIFGHPYKTVDRLSNNYYYTFFKNEVHYVPNGNWFELGDRKLENVDIKSFNVLGYYYAKDKNNAYYQSTIIKNADVSTFKTVSEDKNGNTFAVDKNMLYYGSHSFKDIDVSTYSIDKNVGGGLRVKDKNHEYLADPEVYGEFGSCTLKQDGNCVIYPIRDPKTFQTLTDGYSKDNKTAYYLGNEIPDSLGDTFEVLTGGYSKDEAHVYYKGKQLTGADAKTFSLVSSEDGVSDNFAKDSNKIYLDGLVFSGSDTQTFIDIGSHYFKDKNNVYFGFGRTDDKNGYPASFFPELTIKGADTKTFSLIDGGKNYEAKDAIRNYKSGVGQ